MRPEFAKAQQAKPTPFRESALLTCRRSAAHSSGRSPVQRHHRLKHTLVAGGCWMLGRPRRVTSPPRPISNPLLTVGHVPGAWAVWTGRRGREREADCPRQRTVTCSAQPQSHGEEWDGPGTHMDEFAWDKWQVALGIHFQGGINRTRWVGEENGVWF